MYKLDVEIKGVSPLLQHKYTEAASEGPDVPTKEIGTPDWSIEWYTHMFTEGDYLVQPARHIEGALIKAAALFRIKGQGKKTWKDTVNAYVRVSPENIIHHFEGEPVKRPSINLNGDASQHLSVDSRRAKVGRAAILRHRLMVGEGWVLPFTVEVLDDQMRQEVLREIFDEAGRSKGISDHRPRYGRFQVVRFDLV